MSADAEGSTSASSGEDTVATEAVTTAASPVKVLSFGEGATDVSGVTRDTFVLSTQPSQGAGGHVDMHLAEEGPAVALLAFDITAIEVGSEVLSADLRLSTGERIFGNGTLTTGPASIYRVLEAWEEGVENESPGYANWVDRAPGEPWAAQGVGVGSREAVAMAQFAPTDPATAYTLSIPSDVVQVWVDQPQDNHGLAMTADDPMNYGWVMTSGAVDPDRRPRLTVSFQ